VIGNKLEMRKSFLKLGFSNFTDSKDARSFLCYHYMDHGKKEISQKSFE
jgi:hypothetical protein